MQNIVAAEFISAMIPGVAKKPRKVVDESTPQNVAVHRKVAQALKEWTEKKRGTVKLSKNDAATAFIDFCLRLPAPVQSVIIGGVDEGMERYYADVLKRMAEALEQRDRVAMGKYPFAVKEGPEASLQAPQTEPGAAEEDKPANGPPGEQGRQPTPPDPPRGRRR